MCGRISQVRCVQIPSRVDFSFVSSRRAFSPPRRGCRALIEQNRCLAKEVSRFIAPSPFRWFRQPFLAIFNKLRVVSQDNQRRRFSRSELGEPNRVRPENCQGFMGCPSVVRERQDGGHTVRSCFAWPEQLKRNAPRQRRPSNQANRIYRTGKCSNLRRGLGRGVVHT
jgi:hypothetical protein